MLVTVIKFETKYSSYYDTDITNAVMKDYTNWVDLTEDECNLLRTHLDHTQYLIISQVEELTIEKLLNEAKYKLAKDIEKEKKAKETKAKKEAEQLERKAKLDKLKSKLTKEEIKLLKNKL